MCVFSACGRVCECECGKGVGVCKCVLHVFSLYAWVWCVCVCGACVYARGHTFGEVSTRASVATLADLCHSCLHGPLPL